MASFIKLFLMLICLPVEVMGLRAASPVTLAVRGATVVDVSDWGLSTHDLDNATVLISGGHITAVGPAADVIIPDGVSVIEANGGFLVPGLIDGFAALNNQSYANAYLCSGVTSIIGVESRRRGPLFLEAKPSPHIYKLESVGYQPAPLPDLLNDLEKLAKADFKVALLMYRIEPDQMPALLAKARTLGLATIGELARVTYVDAARMGIDAFVHTTRYSLDLADEAMRLGVEREPFSDDLTSAKWRYYRFLSARTAGEPVLLEYGRRLAEHGAALIPTASLGYLDRQGAQNPWLEPVAAMLDPADIHWPADPKTGKHVYDPEKQEAYAVLADAEVRLDTAYFETGCRYLAGSGTDVWGTMPGISLHHELAYLCRIGHSPRQALAAATSNFARIFRWDELGEIKTGRRADLLLLDKDPRLDIRNLKRISTIVLAGQPIDPQSLLGSLPKPPNLEKSPKRD